MNYGPIKLVSLNNNQLLFFPAPPGGSEPRPCRPSRSAQARRLSITLRCRPKIPLADLGTQRKPRATRLHVVHSSPRMASFDDKREIRRNPTHRQRLELGLDKKEGHRFDVSLAC